MQLQVKLLKMHQEKIDNQLVDEIMMTTAQEEEKQGPFNKNKNQIKIEQETSGFDDYQLIQSPKRQNTKATIKTKPRNEYPAINQIRQLVAGDVQKEKQTQLVVNSVPRASSNVERLPVLSVVGGNVLTQRQNLIEVKHDSLNLDLDPVIPLPNIREGIHPAARRFQIGSSPQK